MIVFGKINNYINSLSTEKNNQLITIGSINIQPNQINVIANKIEFIPFVSLIYCRCACLILNNKIKIRTICILTNNS